ncbi:MAG: FAD-dependent oxidoreductase [Clostridiales Family XIII bacterium]|jgi:Fe-S oxidoreductase|nr:FAD-dependent oxidoreductase [Clostridiales Family XIII bacterium]
MDILETYANDCIRDMPPPCACGCPFRLDVRKFVEKVKRGSFEAAYRMYRDAVLFPRIVSALCAAPCRRLCVRAVQEGSGCGGVDLKSIEASCLARTKNRAPIRYTAPKKEGKIAVIGAGVSGLACAMKLGARGYDVTLYEKEGVAGGAAVHLTAPALVAEEITNETQFIRYSLRLHAAIDSLHEINADAIYIATGKDGADFGLLARHDAESLATREKGIFLGGMLAGTDITGAIEHGMRVSYSIENYLKTGRMDGIESTYARIEANPLFYGMTYSQMTGMPEEGGEEASRCYLCNCDACMEACTMLRHFNKYPKAIAFDIVNTVELVQERNKRVLARLINSCNVCGRCGRVCPVGIDNGKILQESRNRLNAKGRMPDVFHDFWLEDMRFSFSEEAFTVFRRSEAEIPDVLFFPGCQLCASLPDVVKEAFDFMGSVVPNAAFMAACCGAPALWAGETKGFRSVLEVLKKEWQRLGEPQVLCACVSCQKILAEYLPDIRTQSVYTWLKGHWDGNGRGAEPLRGAEVYDPCGARFDPLAGEAVRVLAAQAGCNNLPGAGALEKTPACCGFGGHIYVPNPDLLHRISAERIETAADEIVTWCANCRDMFLNSGKKAKHILEILFSREWKNIGAAPGDVGKIGVPPRIPSLTERRENRRRLKRFFMSADMEGGKKPEDETAVPSRVHFPENVERKMDKLLLLREDVERAIGSCEAQGNFFSGSETEERVGMYHNRAVTVWVSYERARENAFVLQNVYTHRMEIVEAARLDANEANGALAGKGEALHCAKCGRSLKTVKARFHYLGQDFFHVVPGCPDCGFAYVSEALANGKMSEVETMLEDK